MPEFVSEGSGIGGYGQWWVGKVGVGETDKKTRWDWSLGRLCFVDVESTGIWDPRKPPAILEIAAVVTNRDLVELARYTTVVKATELELRGANPFAVTMHLRSGLWSELKRGAGVTLAEAEEALCRMVLSTDQEDGLPIVWVGSSPAALDRPILHQDMPAFHDLFHYRTIDVSTLRLVLQNYAGIELPDSEPDHRALSDCFGVLSFLKAYKERLGALTCTVA